MSGSNDPLEVDLHDLRLYDAEVRICDAIEEGWCNDTRCILLIHGYHNGVAIRSFIQSEGGLRKQIKRNYPEIPRIEIVPCDYGSTYVLIGD